MRATHRNRPRSNLWPKLAVHSVYDAPGIVHGRWGRVCGDFDRRPGEPFHTDNSHDGSAAGPRLRGAHHLVHGLAPKRRHEHDLAGSYLKAVTQADPSRPLRSLA